MQLKIIQHQQTLQIKMMRASYTSS
jgi:hypothetical protein